MWQQQSQNAQEDTSQWDPPEDENEDDIDDRMSQRSTEEMLVGGTIERLEGGIGSDPLASEQMSCMYDLLSRCRRSTI